MLAQQMSCPLSIEAYLEGELESLVKHELIEGNAVAMAGASTNHNRLAGTLFRKLGNHLETLTQPNLNCEVFISDMKVRVDDYFFYPDVVATCERMTEAESGYTDSPVLVAEVLSKSTRKMDQTIKRIAYTGLPTLEEYVLVEQDFVDIEVVSKIRGWQPEHYYLGDTIQFASLGLTLTVEEIYTRVDNDDMRLFSSE